MQNTRWLTRNTLGCWWWWWWWWCRRQKKKKNDKNHLFFKKKRGKRRGVKKKGWASFCGCFAVSCVARGDCLARWWWWWWCSVSMMTHERWEILKDKINFSTHLLLLLPLTTKKKKKNKTMKRRRTFIRLAYHSKHNTTTLCVYVLIIVLWNGYNLMRATRLTCLKVFLVSFFFSWFSSFLGRWRTPTTNTNEGGCRKKKREKSEREQKSWWDEIIWP